MKGTQPYTHFYILLLFISVTGGCLSGKKSITLATPDLVLVIADDSGTNGSAVAYNPIHKLYYTCFAGNSKYPLHTYDENGRIVFSDKCGWDIRGMWYNPNNKYLEINGYDNTGIRTLLMDEHGWASNTVYTLIANGNQPHPNSCPAYDAKNDRLLFYENGYLLAYNREDLELKSRILIDLPCDTSKINSSSPIYTGIEKHEIGLLNYIDKEVYLFNEANGKLTTTYKIPAHVPTTPMLNFSYANGKLWFFNRTKREWLGFNLSL